MKRTKPCPTCAIEWVDQACSTAGIRLTDEQRRQLIAALLARRHLILSGPSGAGKHRLAKALALAMAQNRSSNVRTIQGHPWWAVKTGDTARYVVLQSDLSLWRLNDFVESISPESGLPLGAASTSRDDIGGGDYVAVVERMSPVEVELYFGQFSWWLSRQGPSMSHIPLRLIGTYDSDMRPALDDHVLRLTAQVHLGNAPLLPAMSPNVGRQYRAAR